jgi:hypothetical protein
LEDCDSRGRFFDRAGKEAGYFLAEPGR